jgi:exodeoxyribonuclease-3
MAEQAHSVAMKIVTWNVNSIKAHLEQVSGWVREHKPDVLCLQELKCEDAGFPSAHFEELGYSCAVHGQKTYNGVAILARLPLEDISRGLPGDAGDEQARFIVATAFEKSRAVRVACLYLPNGNPAPGPKYDYKLNWMERLHHWAQGELAQELPLVLCGDYNVIPSALDAKNPSNWTNDALYLPQSRAAFNTLSNLGLTDAFRALHPDSPGHYSFWDYQAGAWPKNNGIRIDHMMLSAQAADLLVGAQIHREARGHEKPSDHVPVEITLS